MCHITGLKGSQYWTENQGVKINYILNITLDTSNGSDLHKHQSTTHILISYSDIHISNSDQTLRVTHLLDLCSATFISVSDLLRNWRNSQARCMFSHSCQWFWSAQNWRERETHLLDVCSATLVSSFDLLKTGGGLTSWMCDQPFLSVVLSVQKLERDSQAGCMFIHSHQWFQSTQNMESSNSLPGCQCVFIHSYQWFWSAQTLESNSQPGCQSIHSHQWFWSAQTQKRNSQPGCMFHHSQQWSWSAQTQESNSLSGWMFSHSH